MYKRTSIGLNFFDEMFSVAIYVSLVVTGVEMIYFDAV